MTNDMQDSEDFLNYIVSSCSILMRLTSFSVDTTYQCRSCGILSVMTDSMNIPYENVYANSILEILTSPEEKVPLILKNVISVKETQVMQKLRKVMNYQMS